MAPYTQNTIWADIKPIPIDLGPAPFAPIQFSDEYKEAMSYFIAVSQAGELSDRVLQLTLHLITLNEALYSVWHTRQLVLIHLQCNLQDEILLLNDMIQDSPKSYQLWHHRQFVMDRLQQPELELDFMNELIQDDAKNYHMWNYRQWLVTRFHLWTGELAFVDNLLLDDVRNNSAWVYRFFLLFGSSTIKGRCINETHNEIEFVISAIRRAPSNESPWVYLRGILQYQNTRACDKVMDLCKTLVEGQCTSAPLFGFLADEYAAIRDINAAIQTCLHLEQVIDKTRAKYWVYRQSLLQKKLETGVS